jgi:PERQ amino acid-rich with GYF domain-containing protein
VTVGPSGKTNPAVAAPPRPTAASVAAASTSARPNGTSALRSATQAPASKPATSPIGGKVEDFPVSPSHEFLKWLSESLKGLNNTVNGKLQSALAYNTRATLTQYVCSGGDHLDVVVLLP